VVSLGGRIFVLGAASAGLGGKGGWSSVNGESWSRLESNQDFDGPVSAFVFKDRMWVPKGDGFRVSSDGVVWDSIPSQFPAPAAYAEAGRIFGVMGDRMMMIETRPAGLGRPTVVEPYPVWSTPDGTHWEKVQADLPFDPTSGEIFEHQNHMVFVGFGYADSRIIYNMIWYSDNQGKNWENAAETYMIPLRMPGEVISYRGDLWEMGWEQVERSSMGVTGTWGKMAGIDGKAVRSQTVVHSGRVFVFRTGEIWVGD
jgi:hypothetical protein